jgi:hypothetical protein
VKYVCLICLDEQKLAALGPDESRRLAEESKAYDALLATRGNHSYVAAALKPVETATTIRMSKGRPSVTDGPFAETKEQLAGFILIEAANLDEAIGIAEKIPALRVGCVEVRAASGTNIKHP